MTAPHSPSLFRFEEADDYRRLRETLTAADYNDVSISHALGGTVAAPLGGKRLPLLLYRARGDTPLETLVRLFILGVPVDAVDAKKAVAPLDLEWWAGRGLVTVGAGHVQATVQLRCYQGLIVAFDFDRRAGAPLRRDHVMGISSSSLTLAGLTVRRPDQVTLDLGTGCGFQALLAAQHSQRVVATDANPRAVEMARFNAALNGLPHVDCRGGDLFAPVEDETFDLIVSNPPFIISPDNLYYFLHSGMSGDDVCRTIARQSPRFLREQGYSQFLANWTVGDGEDWRHRLARWFEGTGCDAWVLRRGDQPPDEYAALWIETDDGDEGLSQSLDRWMRYYERLGVESINSGLITMRRTNRTPWFRADESPETMAFPAGPDILRSFELQDFLAAHAGDDALLSCRFRLAPDVRLDQQARPGAAAWEWVASQLRREEGLHWSGNIDPQGASVLAECDGTRSMAALLADLASSLGSDAEEMAPAWPAVVRRLVERGFLLPVPT